MISNKPKEELNSVLVEYLNNISIEDQKLLMKELQNDSFKLHFLFQLKTVSQLIAAKFSNDVKVYNRCYINFLTTKSFSPFHPSVISMQKFYLSNDYIKAIVNELSNKNSENFNNQYIEEKIEELKNGFEPFWY